MKKNIFLAFMLCNGLVLAEDWVLAHKGGSFAIFYDKDSIQMQEPFLGDEMRSVWVKHISMEKPNEPFYMGVTLNCAREMYIITHGKLHYEEKPFRADKFSGNQKAKHVKNLNGGDVIYSGVCAELP